MTFERGDLLYENPLACEGDLDGFRFEGDAATTFPRGCLRMESIGQRDAEKGLHGHFNMWCPRDFPDNIAVTWNFRPLTDKGLAMAWVAVKGRNGEDLFDPALAPRDGGYGQYHTGDINALHVSYNRRNPREVVFGTCNLRKLRAHLVCQGADPLPDAEFAIEPCAVELIKCGPHLRFAMNDLVLFHWIDDGKSTGPILADGKIGFRQMFGLIAEYADLQVHEVKAIDDNV